MTTEIAQDRCQQCGRAPMFRGELYDFWHIESTLVCREYTLCPSCSTGFWTHLREWLAPEELGRRLAKEPKP